MKSRVLDLPKIHTTPFKEIGHSMYVNSTFNNANCIVCVSNTLLKALQRPKKFNSNIGRIIETVVEIQIRILPFTNLVGVSCTGCMEIMFDSNTEKHINSHKLL